MTQLIIPIFVVYHGCPNRCVFCNEKITAGDFPNRITENTFRETVYRYLNNKRRKADNIQIAFYGGNFTGIDRNYQTRLLGFAQHFLKKGLVDSVRISTRPDYIDNESFFMWYTRPFMNPIILNGQKKNSFRILIKMVKHVHVIDYLKGFSEKIYLNWNKFIKLRKVPL